MLLARKGAGADAAARRRLQPAWVILAGALAAIANFNVVWNHFYGGLPKLFDTGWYAALVYRQTPLMPNPASVVFGPIHESFYSTHFSPFLWVLSLPSYLFDPGPVIWLSIVEGLKHGLLVIVVWFALSRILGRDREVPRWNLPVVVSILVLTPFSGVMLAGSAYTHFELWFVPGAMAFLTLLFRRRYASAVVAMLATVAIREDVGFHLCGLLLVAAVIAVWERREIDAEVRRWLYFAAGGFVWSCMALLVMRLIFPGDSAFGRIYLGDPPFSHFQGGLIAYRLQFLLQHRLYLWGPLVVYVIWAFVARRAWMLIGYLAFVPWFLLNFFAYQHVAATFSLYYSYPFALAILWPLAGMIVFEGKRARARRGLRWVAASLAVSLIGFVQGSEWRPLIHDMVAPRMATRDALDGTIDELRKAMDAGEQVGVDDAVASFDAKMFSARNLFGQTPENVDRVALFLNGRAVQIGWETAGSLPYHYRVTGTPVLMVSRQPLENEHLSLVSVHSETVLPFLRPLGSNFSWSRGETENGLQLVSFGPGWYLPGPNPWEVSFELRIESDDEGPREVAICEVVVDYGERTLASARIMSDALDEQASTVVRTLRFELPEKITGGIQFRVWAADGTRGNIEDVLLRPVEAPIEENLPI